MQFTSRPGRFLTLTSVATALVLVGSACATSTGGADGNTDTTAEAGAAEVVAEYQSPIGDFLGYSNDFGSDESQAKQRELERAAEEKIAACMRAEGFEYTPIDYSQFEEFSLEDEELPWGSKAWVDKYGFGISTQWFSQDSVGPNLVGHNYPEFGPDSSSDPNEEYLNTLSEGEQQAYYAALYGNDDGPEIDPGLSDEEMDALFEEYYNEDYVPTGCANTAWEDQYSEADFEAFYTEFGDILDDMEARFEADPRVAEIKAKTEACVTEKGFTFTDENDVYNDIEQRMENLQVGGNFADPFNGVDPDSLTEDEINAMLQEANRLSDEDKALLAEVQDYELRLAASVFECGGSFFGAESPELMEIRIELEQQFLDENADALKKYEGIGG